MDRNDARSTVRLNTCLLTAYLIGKTVALDGFQYLILDTDFVQLRPYSDLCPYKSYH